MNGTIVRLLDKLLDFHIFLESFYDKLLSNDLISSDYALKNTVSILKSLETKNCKVYKESMDSSSQYETTISDTLLSDVEFSIIVLKQSINSYGIINSKQMFAKAIDFENKQIFLLTKIIGMLSDEIEDTEPIAVIEMLKKKEEYNLTVLSPFL